MNENLYLDNKFNLPIDNLELLKIQKSYIKNARGAGRNRGKNQMASKMLYYEININNLNMPGQRPFNTRMQDIIDNVNGKRILDIGSNIGLIGIFLIYFHGIEHVTFVEHDVECCRIIKKFAELLKIQDKIKIINQDFNSINFEKDMDYNYDCVIMLSSLKYFNEEHRQKSMNYFDKFKCIIFEGDDGKASEEYYEKLFSEKNFNINMICRINDERNRLLYRMEK